MIKSIFFVSRRDFVYVSHSLNYPNGTIVLGAKSIEFEACPPTDDAVRGEIEVAGWILEPYEGGTMATYITQADPKGSIPTSIVNSATKD